MEQFVREILDGDAHELGNGSDRVRKNTQKRGIEGEDERRLVLFSRRMRMSRKNKICFQQCL